MFKESISELTTSLRTTSMSSASSGPAIQPKLNLDPFGDQWKTITIDERIKFHVFSAFYDDRESDDPKIRITAAIPTTYVVSHSHEFPDWIYCTVFVMLLSGYFCQNEMPHCHQKQGRHCHKDTCQSGVTKRAFLAQVDLELHLLQLT